MAGESLSAVLLVAIVGLPALIGLANFSVEAFILGAALSGLSGLLGFVSWPLGVIAWLMTCVFVLHTISRRNARREEERRHKELLRAVQQKAQ